MAEELGFNNLINVAEQNPIDAILDITNGLGADVVVECSGSPKAIAMTADLVRKMGKICVIGLTGRQQVTLDWDKFALSFYDRRTLVGYRIWLDLKKTRHFPDIYNWYMRLVAKKELPLDILLEAMFNAGRAVMSSRSITMKRLYERVKKGLIEICSECGEAYPSKQGSQCAACGGESYYE